VAAIGLLGVAVGGVGNYLIQARISRSADERAAASELTVARANALALGEVLQRVAGLAARMEHTGFLAPSVHWLQSVDDQWRARRELLARHVSAEAYLQIARGFTAADELERQALFRRSFWRPISGVPVISEVLAGVLRRRLQTVYRSRGDRIVHAANLLVAFGTGIDIGSGTREELELIMRSPRVPEEAFLRRRDRRRE
jgi:hypothetical protein